MNRHAFLVSALHWNTTLRILFCHYYSVSGDVPGTRPRAQKRRWNRNNNMYVQVDGLSPFFSWRSFGPDLRAALFLVAADGPSPRSQKGIPHLLSDSIISISSMIVRGTGRDMHVVRT